MEKESKKSYFKEIVLILTGGILASIPTLISTNLQNKAQLQQLILDRKISTLKDYSSTYQKQATDIFFSMDKLEDDFDKYSIRYSGKRFLPREALITLKKDIRSVIEKHNRWTAEMNTHTIIINSLFKTNFPQFKFSSYGLNDSTYSDTSFISWEKDFSEWKKRFAEYRNLCIDILNNEQKVADGLVKIMTEDY
jgi:hypothetical protein